MSIVLGHSDAVLPSSDLRKSELDVLGGDGLGASESGSKQRMVSEKIDFAWQAAAGLEQGLLRWRLEEVEFGTGAPEKMGEIRWELFVGERADVVSNDNALRECFVDGHGKAASEFALAKEQKTKTVFRVHVVVGEQAEVLEHIGSEVVSLVDDEDR
jgi:hypothetical protein